MEKSCYSLYVIKMSRFFAWVLLFVIILFIITGYSMTGKYYMDTIISPSISARIHSGFCYIMVIAFILHSFPQVYFALRRWKWL